MRRSIVLLFLGAALYGCGGGSSGLHIDMSDMPPPYAVEGLNLYASPAVANAKEPIEMRAYLVIDHKVVKGWFSNPNTTSKWTVQVKSGTSTVVVHPNPVEQPDRCLMARLESSDPCNVRVTLNSGPYEKSLYVSWR